jgi:hypothetical protein
VCWLAAPVVAWTPARHPHHTWWSGDQDIDDELGHMVASDVSHATWPFVWPALMLGAVVNLLCDHISAMVHDGTFTGSSLTAAPITLVEEEVRGKLATLMATWASYGDVPCVLKAYMELAFKSVQIQLMREGYVEHVTCDIITGLGYRRVVWPTLIAQDGAEAWQRNEPVAMKKRTAALLCKAVFRLD